MLLENMQREGLTVYEQAQGFQLMLDLGESVSSIADMTGFSETTVRRRVNLLDLDKKEFEKSVGRGATLMDYVALEKIKDTDLKNDVLKTIGTKNFEYSLRNAIDTEFREEHTKRIIDRLNTFAEEIDDYTGLVYAGYYSVNEETEVDIPEDSDTVKYYYTTTTYSIRIYREPTAADEKDDEEKEETPEARERRERGEKLDALARTAFNLRQSFVKNFKPQKKHFNIIATFAAVQMVDSSSFWNFDGKVLGFLGMVTEDGQTAKSGIMNLIEAEPERMLFVMSYLRINEYESDEYHDYLQMYARSEKIDKAYSILEQLGYVMSDDEKALQDGTHELYRPEDPCYRCQYGSGCEECCKMCEDTCGSKQRCRKEAKESESVSAEEHDDYCDECNGCGACADDSEPSVTPKADRVCRECGALDDDVIQRRDTWKEDDVCSSCWEPKCKNCGCSKSTLCHPGCSIKEGDELCERGAEVYCTANSKDQAKIIFDECKSQVEVSPILRKHLRATVNQQASPEPCK